MTGAFLANQSIVAMQTKHSNRHCSDLLSLLSRTVSKEGPNKGRPFYCCSKPRGQGCDFFEWGDTPGPSTAARYSLKGKSGIANSGMTKKRKCGVCHQEGRMLFSSRNPSNLYIFGKPNKRGIAVCLCKFLKKKPLRNI